MKEIITKAHKSWTLIFNWSVSFFAVCVEVALQFAPEIRTQIPPEAYIWFIVFVTVFNKMLRAKTNSSLKER